MANTLAQIRSVRIAGIALFDVILTFLFGWIFEDFFVNQWGLFPCARSYYFALIPIGFIFHLLFGQATALTVAVVSTEFNWQKVFFALLLLGTFWPCDMPIMTMEEEL